MTTVEGSAMLELFVNPTYVVGEFVQQFAVRVPQVAILRTCPNMTLAVERDVKP